MDDIIALIAKAVLAGGPLVVVTLLCGFIFFLLYQQSDYKKRSSEKERKQDELMAQCLEANKAMTEAHSDLRDVIAEEEGTINSKQ